MSERQGRLITAIRSEMARQDIELLLALHDGAHYLPETGNLLCGEPVLININGPEILSEHRAALAEIPP